MLTKFQNDAHSATAWWLLLYAAVQALPLFGIVANWADSTAFSTVVLLYATTVLVGAVVLWWRIRTRPFANATAHPHGLLLAFAALWLLWVLPIEPRYAADALRWALSVLVAGVLLTVRWQPLPKAAWRWGLLLLIPLFWFNLGTVTVYPDYYTDEGFNLNEAMSAAEQGPLYASTLLLDVVGNPRRIGSELIWWPVGGWLNAVGLGVWQGRWLMALSAGVLVALVYRAAWTTYADRRAALVAAFFTATSLLSLYVAHFFRQEIWLMIVLALALDLHARLENKPRFGLALALGLLLALSIEVHNNAFIYAVAFGGYALLRAFRNSVRQRRIIVDRTLSGIVLGGLLGTLVYVLLHIADDPAAFLEQFRYLYGNNYGGQGGLGEILVDRLLLTFNHLRRWYALSVVEGGALGLLALVLLLRPRLVPPRLVLLLLLCFVGWVLMGTRPNATYVSNILPLVALMLGGVVARLRLSNVRRLLLAGTLLVAMQAVTVRTVYEAASSGYNQGFEECLHALQTSLPDEGLILGEHLFWLARPQMDNYAARTLVEWPWPGRTTTEWWAWIDPDIVLWPRVIYGVHYDYVSQNGYRWVELPVCEPYGQVFVREGVDFPADN